jgi:tetratricopeptide (TPR) repeat protein
MRQVLAASLAVLVLMPALRAADEPPDKGKTPRERYQALFQEQQKAMQQFMDVYQKAKNDEERSKLLQEKYPQPQSYVRRFLEIADSAPQDEAAIDCLIWIVQHGGPGPDANRAIDRLAASHAENKRLGEIAPRLVYSLSAKGRACLALGQYLKQQSELVRTLKTDPKRAEQLEAAYTSQGIDKSLFTALRQKESDALTKESEAMFERAANEFTDVSNFRGTIGKTAEAELNEIRNLVVGKPAPEITGEDTDGKPFKLSDYKGKVVVVDFWGDW